MISRVLLRRTLVLPILFAALSACSDDDDKNGTGVGSGSFTLGAPTGATTIVAGSTAQLTLDVNGSGNFRAVTLTADSVPAGVQVGFAPATIVPGIEQTTVSVNVDPSRAAGTFTFRVIARAQGMTDQIQRVTVTTTSPPSYTLTNPTTVAAPVQIQRGQSGTVTLTLTRAGFTGPVDIVPDALPTGVTVANVTNVTGNTATITINTAANASAVAGSFTVRSLNPSMSDRTTTIRYLIIAEPGVQVSAAALTALQANPASMLVTVNREGGFTGPVTVTLSGLPAGVTAAPVTSATGSTVEVPLTISPTATVGAATVTATVTGAGIATKTTTATLTIVSSLLTSGTPRTVSDARARGALTYYRIVVPAGATRLRVTFTGGTGDGDIYLIPGVPDVAAAVAGDFEVDNNEDVIIEGADLTPGDWYIGVEVWNPYANAVLTATVTGPSPSLEMADRTQPAASAVVLTRARIAALRAGKQ